MSLKISAAMVVVFGVVPAVESPAQPVGRSDQITIWVMPNEPAAEPAGPDPKDPKKVVVRPQDAGRTVEEMKEQIAAARKDWGEHRHVTLLNVTDPKLCDELVALNHSYALQSWPVVKGQERILAELEKFAKAENVHVNVCVLDWTPAFNDIREILEHPDRPGQPDIVQIGTTWRAYFSEINYFTHQKLLQPPTPGQTGGLNWVAAFQQGPGETLPLIRDLRLLFYWKRMPQYGAAEHELTIDPTSWETILGSLDEYMLKQPKASRLPPLVAPVPADNPNVVHDYAPLVWAGSGDFIRPGDTSIELTSEVALKVPLLIRSYYGRTDGQGEPYSLFAFPEMSSYEAGGLVIRGRFGGCLAPVSFLPRFHREFLTIYPKTKTADFERCVGIVAPPFTFVGGSDLMITRRTRVGNLADRTFAAARFLATGGYADYLAELGQTPVNREDYGIARTMESLHLSQRYREDLTRLIRDVVKNRGREYSPSVYFPTAIESRETREKFQAVWRRMGDSENLLRQAAREAELSVNLRIGSWRVWFSWWVGNYGAWVVVFVLGFGAIIGLGRWRRSRPRLIRKTVLELDLVGYSKISDNLGQGLSETAVAELNKRIQAFIDSGLQAVGATRASTVMATTGDGAILAFDSPADAHRFAAAFHQATASHNKLLTQGLAKRVFRSGAATGEIVVYPRRGGGFDFAGTTIARAVRLEAMAAPGGMLIDEVTFQDLTDELKPGYDAKTGVPGKRDELFDAFSCQFNEVGPQDAAFFYND